MAAFLSYLFGFPLVPARRLISVDAGSHSIKILLAERIGKRSRVLRRELINLQEEGLISPEEIGPPLQAILRDFGDYPVALALPRHLPLSHILDLQSGGPSSVKQMIDAETLKNRDLRDSEVVYDCVPLKSFGKHQNAFLVTLCKENNVFQQIGRVSLAEGDVCEVSSAATALAMAYKRTGPTDEPAALVDIGADGTLVTLFVAGQEVYTSTFPIGGNLITEAIAAKNDCSVEVAEALKHAKDLFTGENALPAVITFVQGWREQLDRTLKEWQQDNAETNLSPSAFKIVLSGGGAKQPGLLQFLNRPGDLKFVPWPTTARDGSDTLPAEFAIACGTAWHALQTLPQSASLMPAKLRGDWSKRRVHQYLLTASFAVLCATLLLLMIGTGRNYSLAERKDVLLSEAKLALKRAEDTAILKRELAEKYSRLRPVLKRQQQTVDTLNALSSIEKARSSTNLWYVVFADQASYFSKPVSNAFAPRIAASGATNSTVQRNGFVAELCLNQEGEAMRQTLAQVVGALKQSTFFTNVDTLPSDLRRDFANTNVVIADRHFALSLELAPDDFAPLVVDNTATTNINPAVTESRPSNPFSQPR